jgi:putative ABC transport system substrate-binding protein
VLHRSGWVEGSNIRIDYRFAGDDPTLIKDYAAELAGMSPDAILASTNPTIAALPQQTHTMPIVFALVADPVGFGFVQSFARPDGNITGFNSYPEPTAGKWLQLLKEIAASTTRVAVIYSGDVARFASFFNGMIEAAAPSLGLTVVQAPVYDDAGIEQTLAAFASEPGGSLIALPNSFNTAHGGVIVAATLRHGLPLIGTPDFPRRRGLLSYSLDLVERHAQAAGYVDRILRGANPG